MISDQGTSSRVKIVPRGEGRICNRSLVKRLVARSPREELRSRKDVFGVEEWTVLGGEGGSVCFSHNRNWACL